MTSACPSPVPHELRRGTALVSDDASRLDIAMVHGFLASSYWARGMSEELLRRAIANSISFGVYVGDEQVGFARAITDRATYAYLSDVFVLEAHRGRGLSKLLMEAIVSHPDLQGLRRFALLTRDAAGLYRQFGFRELEKPEMHMEIAVKNPYS